MAKNVCVCRSCVDPRESGLFAQHGLPYYGNGIYMPRNKGAFVRKTDPHYDVSTTGVMLIQMGNDPTFILQGHRDCAAVRTLFETQGKKLGALNKTEREFLRFHGEALEEVLSLAADLPTPQQLRILEKICVLQGINNLYSYRDLAEHPGHYPAYAYYSATHLMSEEPIENPEKIGLRIFDPRQGVFATASNPSGNRGIRIVDLIDLESFVPRSDDPYQIKGPIDLEEATRNEVRVALSGSVPSVDAAMVS